MTNHDKLYEYAKYYDVAFDFKNVPEECDFVAETYLRITGRRLTRFIELGAGPGNFAIEFARRGVKSLALDISPAMVAYGISKAGQADVPLTYVCDDMITFRLKEQYEMAALLMDSSSYLLDNETVYRHLESVALSLTPGGIYLLEMEHPREIFTPDHRRSSGWTIERDGITVHCEWGHADDASDPTTQITNVTARFEYSDGEKRGVIEETAPQRCFTANEFKALVDASGLFRIEAIYGAMDDAVPFNNEKKAWRMVPVLVKM